MFVIAKRALASYYRGTFKFVAFFFLGLLLMCSFVLIPTVLAAWCSESLIFIRTGDSPRIRHLYHCDRYIQKLCLTVVLCLFITLGIMLFIIPGVLLAVWWLYSFFYLVDKNTSFVDALVNSKDVVTREGNYLKHLKIVLLISILNLTALSCGGLVLMLTLPYSIILLGLCYLDLEEPLEVLND